LYVCAKIVVLDLFFSCPPAHCTNERSLKKTTWTNKIFWCLGSLDGGTPCSWRELVTNKTC